MRQFLDVVRVIRAGENGAAIDSPHLATPFLPNVYQGLLFNGAASTSFGLWFRQSKHVQEELGLIFEWDGNANLGMFQCGPDVRGAPTRVSLTQLVQNRLLLVSRSSLVEQWLVKQRRPQSR